MPHAWGSSELPAITGQLASQVFYVQLTCEVGSVKETLNNPS